jgi:hypothetical protein
LDFDGAAQVVSIDWISNVIATRSSTTLASK